MKKTTETLTLISLIVSTLCYCGIRLEGNQTLPQIQINSTQSDSKSDNATATEHHESAQTESLYKTSFTDNSTIDIRDTNVTPSITPYTVEPDLSNIDNLWQYEYLGDSQKELLAQNSFMICSQSNEFFEVYEQNRYDQLASFITVDSLMHTYHLYFSYLMKNTEKNYLADSLKQLSRQMLDNSIKACEKLKGTQWENAAQKDAAFFNVALKLLDDSAEIYEGAQDIVTAELDSINAHEGIKESLITGDFEDYTQYIPRGYYEGDRQLEQYFKAMMWYGRIHFRQEDEEMDKCACLTAMMLSEDRASYDLWKAIYETTSFFAGASDDLGVNEYMQALEDVYGKDATVDTLISDDKAFERFHKQTAALPLPHINSIPIGQGEDNTIRGFRFMGQRFTIDAAIMQRLIYSEVAENSQGEKRMFPDTLDVPAALGSSIALNILNENGAADYQNYSENMDKLKTYFAGGNTELWSASLYSCWLDTLRPLLEPKGEGYPMFMQSEEWLKKDLECFAGSFAELKHDTVLYSKQIIAEMGGGGWEQEPDDRGYVEPEPLVYARFAELSDKTLSGLKAYNILSKTDEENLTLLSQMADMLLEISKKELQEENLTDDEYEFIKSYGGSIEHFWTETVKDQTGGEYVSTQECPAAIVVDIATNPDSGEVLEVATDNPSYIYVIVKVDGKLKIARGSEYSFYQFAWPMDDRLTDAKWRQMMGINPGEDGSYSTDSSIQKPSWTESYRFKYEWE